MKLAVTIHKVKTMTGSRIRGYKAEFREICTETFPTAQEAEAHLLTLIENHCMRREPRVLVAAGHTGVLHVDMYGMVGLQHVWPDGHISSSFGGRSLKESADDFFLHVAETEWDGTSTEVPAYLPESRHGEYRSWLKFVTTYKQAIADGKTDNEAHRIACGY